MRIAMGLGTFVSGCYANSDGLATIFLINKTMILKFNGTQILNNFTNEVVFADRIISQTFNSDNTFEFVFASKAKITGTYQKVGDEYILNLTNGYTKDEIDAQIGNINKILASI